MTNKGLNHLKSLINQTIGNGECYACTAEYAGYMDGPGLGAGTRYPILHDIGSIATAAEIGEAYDWRLYGWEVIRAPRYDQLTVGAIINWRPLAKISDVFHAPEFYGHTGVIRGIENGKFLTYEQNAESGRRITSIVREFYAPSMIASVILPPREG